MNTSNRPWTSAMPSVLHALVEHRYLLLQLVRRDVLLRYRGAYFGLVWIFLNPLILLAVFTFVFGHIFQARWPLDEGSVPFGLSLYCGLIAFNIFADTVGRAPMAVRSYPSYVKKIIFPVELLPLVPLGAALIHAAFNSLILVAALAWYGQLHGGVMLLPVLVLPLVVCAAGLGWLISAWGVFIKDMSQIVPVVVQLLLFLSPVFYPAKAVPPALQPLYTHNPIGSVIGAMRAALNDRAIDWSAWLSACGVALVITVASVAFFQRARDEFADAM